MAKLWIFSFRISPSNEYSWLISLRIDLFNLLAGQGTLKSLLQFHSSKVSIHWCSAFFWRRKWQSTLVNLPEEFHGQRSLAGYSSWGCKESGMTEQLSLTHSAFFMVQLSHPYVTNWKTITLTILTFVSKVLSLLFNMLSRCVIPFLPRSKCLLISWLQSPSTVILGSLFPFSPFYLQWSDGTRCHNLSFWMLSFKPAFSLFSFTFIKRFFSSFTFSAIRVVLSSYLKLLIFLSAILPQACASPSLPFHMMYSA